MSLVHRTGVVLASAAPPPRDAPRSASGATVSRSTPHQRNATEIVIAGGSIGGLALFSSLRKQGLDNVRVYEERAGALGGAARSTGVVIWPSGLRHLRMIDARLADDVCASGSVMESMLVRTPQGAALQSSSPGFRERHGEPAVMIRWASLHQILQSKVPSENLLVGRRLSSFSTDASGRVSACFAGADGAEERVGADVLVGCDGIRSRVRELLLGPEGPPRDGGRVVFRTVVPTSALPEGVAVSRGSALTLAAGKTGAIMDVGSGHTYCAIGALDEHIKDLPASASKRDRCLAVLRAVASEGGWPLHAAVFAAADEADIREERIVDRPPLEAGLLAGAGPVTLLGDALHPMVPSVGFGAVSAIEGAVELAQCLSAAAGAAAGGAGKPLSPAEAAAALRRYEGARLFRATSVQLQSFAQGSDSYKWGAANGGRVPSANALGGGAPAAPAAQGAPAAPPPPPPSAGGSPSFQDWLASYRSPWSEGAEAEAKVPAGAGAQ